MTSKSHLINKEEKEIIGSWAMRGERVIKDSGCQRVEWLIENHLTFISHDKSGWNALYYDPIDNRLWECIYLHGEMHGGGAPSLRLVDKEYIDENYGNIEIGKNK